MKQKKNQAQIREPGIKFTQTKIIDMRSPGAQETPEKMQIVKMMKYEIDEKNKKEKAVGINNV